MFWRGAGLEKSSFIVNTMSPWWMVDGSLQRIILTILVINSHRRTGFCNRTESKEISKSQEVREYCQLELFHASCPDDEIILMETSVYGRMRLGRCVKRDYGFLGCSSDVLEYVDRLCSGRRSCDFQVAQLHVTQPCPGDLTPFLEASFKCLSVITAHEHKCNAHAPISLPLDTGYLSSFVTMTTGRGNPDCPWRIRVHPGQHVNISLINFARVGLPADWEVPASTRPKICYQLACIRERQHTRTLTECEGSARLTHAYTSTSNLVEIDIIVAKVLNVYFLLHYKAIGCANLHLNTGLAFKRRGDFAIVKCNATNDIWRLQCINSKWEGYLDNCSLPNGFVVTIDGAWNLSSLFSHDAFPYSILLVVSVGVALGVFVGGVLLVCTTRFLKRRHESLTASYDIASDDQIYQTGSTGPGENNEKTIVISCDTAAPFETPEVTITDICQSIRRKQQPCRCTIYDNFSRDRITSFPVESPRTGSHLYESATLENNCPHNQA